MIRYDDTPGLSTVLEEELTSKENLTRQCQRAEAEVTDCNYDDNDKTYDNDDDHRYQDDVQANNWRLKFEKEGVAKIEELESTKMKLQVMMVILMLMKYTELSKARLAECEVTVESLNSKLMQLEKSKAQLQVCILIIQKTW